MSRLGKVTLAQVTRAVEDLGGEAEWCDILRQLSEIRGDDYSYYRHYESYEKTAFQVIQCHCLGYEKFRGPIRFERVGKERFRLCAVLA